jgi:15,16-dihydrobiliverdin:ferredoxin oxidoreductase
MTYFDGGSALQAFNRLLYPDFRYDVPMLGIDFGANKILCAVDFAPLTQDPSYLENYTSQLSPFQANIADYCGRMTTKFYDENQFFSKQLIFIGQSWGPKIPF